MLTPSTLFHSPLYQNFIDLIIIRERKNDKSSAHRPLSTDLLTQGEVLSIAYNNPTTFLASAGMDKSILIWDCKDSYSNILNLKAHTNAVTTLAWSHTDRLASGSADKNVCSWDM